MRLEQILNNYLYMLINKLKNISNEKDVEIEFVGDEIKRVEEAIKELKK